jgi:hypothetical protein
MTKFELFNARFDQEVKKGVTHQKAFDTVQEGFEFQCYSDFDSFRVIRNRHLKKGNKVPAR